MKTHGKKLALVLAIVLMGSLLLVGCGGGGSGTSTGGGAASTATPASTAAGGDDTSTDTGDTGDTGSGVVKKDHITYELYAVPNVFDPQVSTNMPEWHVNRNIYEGLFMARQQDWDYCEPWLVESYEISDDHCNWTLKLREGVLFHNGEEMTADDVVFTLERCRVKPISAAGIATITGVSKIDTYTVYIEQDSPYPILIEALAGPQFGIVNKALIEEYGEGARETIIGTGAYKFKEWTADNNVTIEYFEDWFKADEEGIPEIKSCTYRPIVDANAATIAFDSGELDVFWRSVQTSDYERYRADPNVHTEEVLQASRRGLSMNNEDAQFGDVRVRRAMNHAMDKEAINIIAVDGQCKTDVHVKTDDRAEGYAKADAAGKIIKYDYDQDKAKALLAEAGYDENNPLRTVMTSSTSQPMQAIAVAMQDYMAQVNVIAEVDIVEHAQYMERVSTGNFECAAAQWGFEFYWSPLTYLVHVRTGYYYAYERNQIPRANELIDEAYGTWELDKREEMYAEMLNLITDEAICVPVYQTQSLHCTTKGLQCYYDKTNIIASLMWMEWVDE